MGKNVESLKALYVACAGNLTDTYEDIANGIPVSDYVFISDCILAISKKMADATAAVAQLVAANS